MIQYYECHLYTILKFLLSFLFFKLVSSDDFNLQGKKCQYSITNKVHIFAEVAQTYYTELLFFVSMNWEIFPTNRKDIC